MMEIHKYSVSWFGVALQHALLGILCSHKDEKTLRSVAFALLLYTPVPSTSGILLLWTRPTSLEFAENLREQASIYRFNAGYRQ